MRGKTVCFAGPAIVWGLSYGYSENLQVHGLQLNVERVFNMNPNWQTLPHEVHMRVRGVLLLILFLPFWQLV
jgi:hypothetical protein